MVKCKNAVWGSRINIAHNKQTVVQDPNLSFAKILECSAVQKMASFVHHQILYRIPEHGKH